MTTEELREIAVQVAEVPTEQVEELAGYIFDEVEASRSVAEVQEYNEALLNAGVDVAGICRKKHPV